MEKRNLLVMESDISRAGSIVSAMQFLGYEPHLWDTSMVPVTPTGGWHAVYIGTMDDRGEDNCRQALAALNGKNDRLLVLASEDSGQAAWLASPGSIFGQRLELLQFPLRYDRLAQSMRNLQARRSGTLPLNKGGLVGSSAPISRVNALIRQVAPFDSSVLVLGDSGTGKEMVARSIHECSERSDKPFVAINCGAIPAELLESELFGHEKGSFTGAISARKGRFELAEGGTLFLDEIGDMSLPMQVKLLRVLQERVYERVGGNRSLVSNVRIIAATHRNLELAITEGRFREDLFYRLNVFPLLMPSLRDHLDDLPELINEFNQRLMRRGLGAVRFSSGAMQALYRSAWPGNVRELCNLVERLSILFPHSEVRTCDLPEKYRGTEMGTQLAEVPARAMLGGHAFPTLSPSVSERPHAEMEMLLPDGGVDLKEHLSVIEVGLIRQALDLTDGVVAHAAKLLRMQRTTLVEKLRKYGLQTGIAA